MMLAFCPKCGKCGNNNYFDNDNCIELPTDYSGLQMITSDCGEYILDTPILRDCDKDKILAFKVQLQDIENYNDKIKQITDCLDKNKFINKSYYIQFYKIPILKIIKILPEIFSEYIATKPLTQKQIKTFYEYLYTTEDAIDNYKLNNQTANILLNQLR